MDIDHFISGDQHPIDRLIEEVLKQDRIDSAKKDIHKSSIENKKLHKGNSAVSRLLQLFIENPDKQYTPNEITEEHLRMKSGTCRARLSELFEAGYIRKVWDPVHSRYHYGLYELNVSEPLIHPGTAPRCFHGYKIHLKRPLYRIPSGKGKNKVVQCSPDEFRARLYSSEVRQFIKLSEKDTNLNHAWVFEGFWRKRRISVTVQHGNSSLIEIWCKATEKPLDIDDFIEYNRMWNCAIPDIWVESTPLVVQLGINHDIPRVLIDGVQRLKVQALHEYMVQAYNKDGVLRIESHINKAMPQTAVMRALQGTVLEVNSFFDRVDLSVLEKQNKQQFDRIKDLQDQMGVLVSTLTGLGVDVHSLGDHMKIQGERVLDIIGEMSNLNQVLNGFLSTTPPSGYIPPGLGDNSGYG